MKIFSSLFSIVGVLLVAAVIFIAVIVLIIITARSTAGTHKTLKIFIYIAGGIVLVVASGFFLLSNFSSRSKVDVSPLYNLTDISFVDSETMESIMRDVTEYEAFGTIKEDERTNLFIEYSFVYGMQDEPGYAWVTVYHYNDAEKTRARFGEKDGNCVRIQVSDSIAADLYNSEMGRNADQLYAAYWEKDTRTQIMFSNLYIYISETSNFSSAGKSTSKAIEALCDIIAEAARK